MTCECPYCEKEVKLNHDDGEGFEEDKVYNRQCSNCGKKFIYITRISFTHTGFKAPCLNGGEHKWAQVIGWPKEEFKNKYRCDYCDEQRTIDFYQGEE